VRFILRGRAKPDESLSRVGASSNPGAIQLIFKYMLEKEPLDHKSREGAVLRYAVGQLARMSPGRYSRLIIDLIDVAIGLDVIHTHLGHRPLLRCDKSLGCLTDQ
jgi:hypothetical protein